MDFSVFQWSNLNAASLSVYVDLSFTNMNRKELEKMVEAHIEKYSNNESEGYEKAWEELMNSVNEISDRHEKEKRKELRKSLEEFKISMEDDLINEEIDIKKMDDYKDWGEEIESIKREIAFIHEKRKRLKTIEHPNWLKKIIS